jgi:hypothetical protein
MLRRNGDLVPVFALALFVLLNHGEPFVVGADASTSYTVDLSRDALREYIDDIGLFQRNMPGVVGVTPLGGMRYLYQTEKQVPLAAAIKTDFVIAKSVASDSVTVYESVNPDDLNYMFCRVVIRPLDSLRTMIHIVLRLKLTRESASEIHWLAPVLGSDFMSDQMSDDLNDMLQVFVQRSNQELSARLTAATARCAVAE